MLPVFTPSSSSCFSSSPFSSSHRLSQDCTRSSTDLKQPDSERAPLCLDDFPDSVLLDILFLVAPKEHLLGSCALVCKRWRRLCLDASLWKTIRILPPHSNKFTDEALTALLNNVPSKMVKTLDLRYCGCLSDLGIVRVPRSCPKLQTLELVDVLGADSSFVAALVRHCPDLEELVLRHCVGVFDQTVGMIARGFPRLRRLELDHCSGVSKQGMLALTRPRKRGEADLERLSILHPRLEHGLLSRIVRIHRNLKSLRAFSLAVDPSAVEAIAGACKGLEHLIVKKIGRCFTEWKSATLDTLTSGCPKLVTLQLYYHSLNATDSSLQKLAADCPNLESLAVDGSLDQVPVSKGVRTLMQSCRNLRSVKLLVPCDDVDDGILETIAIHLKQLEALQLPYCSVSDEGVSRVARSCRHLEILHLSGPVTDESARAIAQSPASNRLRGLALDRAEITDVGLHAICSSLPLTHLALHNWTRISDGALMTAVPLLADHVKALHIAGMDGLKHPFVRRRLALAVPHLQTVFVEAGIHWDMPGVQVCYFYRLSEEKYTPSTFFSSFDDNDPDNE